MQTKAIALVRHGEAATAFQEMEVQLPELKTHQVLIEVDAFGLNYAEVMARRGLYGDAPPLPAVLGYEVVGRIVQTGENVDSGNIGKRVLAFCRFGGYAQHVIVEDFAFAELGDYETGKALALATQYVTAYYMVERVANVQTGERVLVHAAAGGVGTALIQLCKRKGAIVFAKVSSASKAKLVKEQGADFAVNYTDGDYEDTVTAHLDGKMLDVSFNPVAGSTTKKDSRLLGSGSRLVLFGGSELGKARFGIFSKLNFVRKMGLVVPIGLMMKSKSVLGVNMLRIADDKPEVLKLCLHEVVELAKNGSILPQVGGAYSSSELSQAHADLESGKTTGKLVIYWKI
jgi:NADPH:quinone reductase-like Zn-dependent oxidoreductase